MRCEGVAERVRRCRFGKAKGAAQTFHEQLGDARRERSTLGATEHRFVLLEFEGTELEIARYGLLDRGEDRHQAFLAALADDAQRVAPWCRCVGAREAEGFGNA